MLELQARQKLKKRIYSRPTLVALIILAALAVKGTWNVYWKYEESKENLLKTEQQADALRAREYALTAQIAALNTEKGVEREIRKKFSVVKDGEQVIVLVDGESEAQKKATTTPGLFDRMWSRMWSRIKDVF